MLRLPLRMARPRFALLPNCWEITLFRAFANHRLGNGLEFKGPRLNRHPARAPQFRGQFSTLFLASRRPWPHFSISDLRKAESWAGVEPFGLAPSSSNRDFTDAWTSAALVSTLILAMTSFDVFAGTKKPNHENTSKPGTPDSAMVGISGTTATRSLVVTASPRRLPPFTCGRIEGMLSKMTSTRQGIGSWSAGAPPRYGICVISPFASRLNSSPLRCSVVPLPDEA